MKRELDAGLCWRELDPTLRIECYVAGKMEEGAKSEGEDIHYERQPEHSAMAIEELLRYISKELLPRKDPLRDSYRNYAGIIADLFSPGQREALIHLLSRVVNQHERRFRRKRMGRGGHELVKESKVMPRWLEDALHAPKQTRR